MHFVWFVLLKCTYDTIIRDFTIMKSQKLYVSRTTLWRHAMQDMSRSINADTPAGTANEEDTMCMLACIVQTDNAVKPVDDVLGSYVATDALNSVHCSTHDVFTDVLTAGVFEFETSVGWR
jgi:hypothetical protein